MLRSCRRPRRGLWDQDGVREEGECDRDGMRGCRGRTRDQAYFAFENCRQGWESDGDPTRRSSSPRKLQFPGLFAQFPTLNSQILQQTIEESTLRKNTYSP